MATGHHGKKSSESGMYESLYQSTEENLYENLDAVSDNEDPASVMTSVVAGEHPIGYSLGTLQYEYVQIDTVFHEIKKPDLSRSESLFDRIKSAFARTENDYKIMRNILKAMNVDSNISLSVALDQGYNIQNKIAQKGRQVQPKEVPYVMLHKLLMLDSNGRFTSVSNEKKTDIPRKVDGPKLHSPSKGSSSFAEHPLDIFYTIFPSCDLLLRQVLSQKMLMCRLAIPLLYKSKSNPKKNEYRLTLGYCSLQSISLEWKYDPQKPMEHSLIDGFFLTIGFVRLGRPLISKSNILNRVIDKHSFPTFVHRDIVHTTQQKKVADGIVEAGFFLPSQKGHFEYATMICNMRGDGNLHKAECSILSAMSCLLFIFIDQADLDEGDMYEQTKEIRKRDPAKTFFILSKPYHRGRDQIKMTKKWERILWKGYEPICTYDEGGSPKSTATIADEILGYIKHLQPGEKSDGPKYYNLYTNLGHMKSICSQRGVAIDIDEPGCEQALEEAEGVVNYCAFQQRNPKESFLKMQGQAWEKISLFQKQKHHQRSSDISILTKLEEEIHNCREEQFQILKSKCSPMIEAFIHPFKPYIHSSKTQFLPIYLQTIKSFLHHASRKTLAPLQKEYRDQWEKMEGPSFQNAKKSMKERNEDNLAQIKHSINSSDLGLGHIFRELGQMYETYMYMKERGVLKSLEFEQFSPPISDFPTIGALAFKSGFPIEILDGNTSNIPLQWIGDILQKARNLLSNKRVLVLSVLGFQSSGKSTLLNSMFGSDFSVSSGKCTRGISMQLLPLKLNDADNVIVIDTEGIGSSEGGGKSKDHDNMLATLAIGLGDVSIVNIKGENSNQMADVLQIVAHAFLRIKIVNRKLKLKKRCIFVHQNASAINVESKTLIMRQEVQRLLDEKTREVAETEGRKDVKAFKDVIMFDYLNDIYFMCGLWNGNPPMATVNTDYCNMVFKLKQHILSLSNLSKMTLTQFGTYLRDLWEAIITTDFVFNFKNTQELRDYYAIEDVFYNIYWSMDVNITNATKKEITCMIANAIDSKALSIESINAKTNIREFISAECKRCENKFSDNIKSESDSSEERWIHDKLVALKNATIDLKTQAFALIERAVNDRNWYFENSQSLEVENDILLQIDSLFKSKQILKRNHFDRLWEEWTQSSAQSLRNTEQFNMSNLMEDDLETLTSDLDKQYLKKDLQNINATNLARYKKLPSSLKIEDLVKEGLLNIKVDGRGKLVQNQAKVALDIILRQSEQFVKDLNSINRPFDGNMIRELIKVTSDQFDIYAKDDTVFGSSPALKIRILVWVGRWATPYFEWLQSVSQSGKVENRLKFEYYERALGYFESLSHDHPKEKRIAILLVNTIVTLIRGKISDDVTERVIREFKKTYKTKRVLLLHIMCNLVETENFDNFKHYLNDAKAFATTWLERHIEQYLAERIYIEGEAVTNIRYMHEDIFAKAIECIEDIIEDQHVAAMPYCTWLERFCKNIQEKLSIHLQLAPIMTADPSIRLQSFKIELREKLLYYKSQSTKFLAELSFMDNPGQSPASKLIEKLWTCRELCPMCGEPCLITHHRNIKKHECIQHRIKAVSYFLHRDSQTNELDLSTCSRKVTRKEDIEIYREQITDWKIEPDAALEKCNFWKWFIYTFRAHMANKAGQIPREWRNIGKTMATDSLHRQFGIESREQFPNRIKRHGCAMPSVKVKLNQLGKDV